MKLFEHLKEQAIQKIIQMFDLNYALVITTTVAINLSYTVLGAILTRMYPETYTILPRHRKQYIVKNALKGIYLFLLSVWTFPTIFSMIYFDVWDNYQLHNMTLMYMLPDLIALIRVRKLQMGTIKHHVSVVIFAFVNLFLDYSVDTHWRALMVYGFMSMWTGSVNFYLAYRLVEHNPRKKGMVACVAMYNYRISLIINWTYQLYCISRWILFVIPLWSLYFYMALMSMIVIDDINLHSVLSGQKRKYFDNMRVTRNNADHKLSFE